MVSGNNFQKKKTLLLHINDFDSDFLEKEIAPKKTYFPLVPIYNIVLQWWPSWISDPKLKKKIVRPFICKDHSCTD
jgi:hypothetical protein